MSIEISKMFPWRRYKKNPVNNNGMNEKRLDKKVKKDMLGKVDPRNTMKLKYRDNRTGEVHEVDWTGENFNVVMGDRNYSLIFD